MEASNRDDAKLGSLRELWDLVGQALRSQVVSPPHVIEKIISALTDAQQWFAPQAYNGQNLSVDYDNHPHEIATDPAKHLMSSEVSPHEID